MEREVGQSHGEGIEGDAIQELTQMLLKAAKMTLPFLEEGTRSGTANRFEQAGAQLMETSERIYRLPATVDKALAELGFDEDSFLEMEDDDEFAAQLDEFGGAVLGNVQEKCKKIGMKEVKKNKAYQSFKKELDSIVKGTELRKSASAAAEPAPGPSNSYSEGFEALTDYIPTTDPLTRKPLTDPCVNQICGHVYEYSSIMEFIACNRTGKTMCPYPVCKNKNPLKATHLKKEKQLAAKIAERIREEGAV